MPPISLYVHWPFCLSKCSYCAFVSRCKDDSMYSNIISRIVAELDYHRDVFEEKNLVSIFFGGGTPSLIQPRDIEKIIRKVFSIAHIANDIEITLEANPETVDVGKLLDFKNAGINRLSMGCQSFIESDLKFLGRNCSAHKTAESAEAVANVFSNFSFDLMYGFVSQTEENLFYNLKKIHDLSAKHVSLYKLTFEEQTPMHEMLQKGKINDISDEREAQLYRLINEQLKKYGFYGYEISNYAKSAKFESVHNLAYWNYKDYLGIGPSAHSRITIGGQKHAGENKNQIETWLNSHQKFYPLTETETQEEIIFMGLRTKYGVDLAYLSGIDLSYFLKNNLLKIQNENKIVIPPDKYIISDYIIKEIISAIAVSS